jgi:hypothetical protein
METSLAENLGKAAAFVVSFNRGNQLNGNAFRVLFPLGMTLFDVSFNRGNQLNGN